MAAPATPEVATDVNFSNAETGRMPTPNKLNLSIERIILQPGAIGNKPPTSGVASGDYMLVQKADGKLYKVPATSLAAGLRVRRAIPGPRVRLDRLVLKDQRDERDQRDQRDQRVQPDPKARPATGKRGNIHWPRLPKTGLAQG